MNSGTTKSALIRFLAKTFVEHAVRDDGSVSLPVDWAKLLPSADARASYMVAETHGDHSPVTQHQSQSASDALTRKPVKYSPEKRAVRKSKAAVKKKGTK